MSPMNIQTFGELKASYPMAKLRRSVKQEVRENLIQKLQSDELIFPGIQGYQTTVIPALINAILAQHNFILLGLRGQAKSRILRSLIELLDPTIPALPTELRDNPLFPLSEEGKQMIATMGDEAPIIWVPAAERYVEKLATPDTTVADLIGDIDPIKAARHGTGLADLASVHYGLLPRANRGIFAVNELADLAPKVQVSLFNILQEGDVQIRGYPIRLPLDVWLVFSANPQDYTARGKIVTPLKDRIGSEIRTHYPQTLDEGMQITAQEAWVDRTEGLWIPPFIAASVEAVAFAARNDRRIDQNSGVSQRLAISLMELVASNAEQRALRNGELPVARPLDLYRGAPAVSGKVELEYEGEMIGAERIVHDLILAAFANAFGKLSRGIDTSKIVEWFEAGNYLKISEGPASAVVSQMQAVPGLVAAARKLAESSEPERIASAGEFVLEGLAGRKKLSRGEEAYSAPSPSENKKRWGN